MSARVLVVVATALALGCGQEAGRGSAPERSSSAVDDDHVVFTRRTLVVDRLREPVPLPVTASSRPSPAILSSDAPAVATIDEAGRLVAHAPGSALIRSLGPGGGTLMVNVYSPSRLSADPERIVLGPGERVPVRLLDEQGRLLPEGAGVWSTSAPDAVVFLRGTAHAFQKTGEFELRARLGGASVTVPVSIRSGPERLRIQPVRARVKRAEIVLFQLTGTSGAVAAEWSSEQARVLSSIGRGLFQGLEPGSARVCARAGTTKVCADVEVAP